MGGGAKLGVAVLHAEKRRLHAHVPVLALQLSTKEQEAALRDLQAKHGVDGEQHAKAK